MTPTSDRYLSTYYFHGQDLCIVPRHVREDVAWMVEHQVDGVFVGVHEADLLGGNLAMVCEIIREAGLDLWLIPSRVGGLVAGWGRQPGFLSVNHPEWWARQRDGSARESYGPQLSVFHPEVPGAVAQVLLKMLEQFPATGIVWDEIKTMAGEDHSKAAIATLGHPAGACEMASGTRDCFSQINTHLKAAHPALKIAAFLYCYSPQSEVEEAARIACLDQFGCDGKGHFPGESGVGEGGELKALLGGHDARFAAAALANHCLPFTLLETQLLDAPTLERTLLRLPEFLGEKRGHLAFYYYPYGMENPDHYMPLIGEKLAQWRRAVQ